MADAHSLMRPLRSDSLKPRPSTQAVWEPATPAADPQPGMAAAADPPCEPAPQLLPFPTFAPKAASGAAKDEPQKEETLDLDAAIAAVLAQEDDEDDPSAAEDALPTEKMPEPVFVPLYGTDTPKRKKKGWLWLLLIVLAAGGAYAA